MRKLDLTGKIFGRLAVIDMAIAPFKRTYWLCLCECGNKTNVNGSALVNGSTKSCGCLRFDIRNKVVTHEMSKTKTYEVWCSMIARCNNPNSPKYSYYGGRGIIACNEWLKFEHFYASMGECPESYQIDRIDNDIGYCQSNCRWVSRSENMRNRRNSKWWFIHGSRYDTLSHAAESTGINRGTLQDRFDGKWEGYSSILKYPKPH